MPQKVMMVAMPSEASNEQLTNDRLKLENNDGWEAVSMQTHNGYLVFLMDKTGD